MADATLDELRKIAERVRTAERDLADARRARDAAIRAVRAGTKHTVQEIADAADVSLATAKIALRGM